MKSSAVHFCWKAPCCLKGTWPIQAGLSWWWGSDKMGSLRQVGSFRLCRHWHFQKVPLLSTNCVSSLNAVTCTEQREANFVSACMANNLTDNNLTWIHQGRDLAVNLDLPKNIWFMRSKLLSHGVYFKNSNEVCSKVSTAQWASTEVTLSQCASENGSLFPKCCSI